MKDTDCSAMQSANMGSGRPGFRWTAANRWRRKDEPPQDVRGFSMGEI